MKSKILIIMLLLSFTFVFAQPPQATQIGIDDPCEIAYPRFQYVALGSTFNLSVEVFDKFQGLNLDDTEIQCIIKFTRPDGTHIIDHEAMSYLGDDFEYFLNDTVFNANGIYSFLIRCNGTITDYKTAPDTIIQGGCYANGVVEVTPSGNDEIGEGQSYIILLSFAFMLLFVIALVYIGTEVESKMFSIILFVTALVFAFICLLYSMVLIDTFIFDYQTVIDGYSTFFEVMMIGAIAFTVGFTIIMILIGIKFYKFKRGWIE